MRKVLILLSLIICSLTGYGQANLLYINGSDTFSINIPKGNPVYHFTDDTLFMNSVDVLARNFISSSETVSRTIYVSDYNGYDSVIYGTEENPLKTLDFALNSLSRTFLGVEIVIQVDTGDYSINNFYDFSAFSSNLIIRGTFDTVVTGLSPTNGDYTNKRILNTGFEHEADTFLGYFCQKTATNLYPIFKSDADTIYTAGGVTGFNTIVELKTRISIPTFGEFNIKFDGDASILNYEYCDISLTGEAKFENATRIVPQYCNIRTDASEDNGLLLLGNVLFRQDAIFCNNPTGDGIELQSNTESTNLLTNSALIGSGSQSGIAIEIKTEKWVPAVAMMARNFNLVFDYTSNGGYFELVNVGAANSNYFLDCNKIVNMYYGAVNFRRIDQGSPLIIDNVDYVVYNQTPDIYSNSLVYIPEGNITGTPNISYANFTNSVDLGLNSIINLQGLELKVAVGGEDLLFHDADSTYFYKPIVTGRAKADSIVIGSTILNESELIDLLNLLP